MIKTYLKNTVGKAAGLIVSSEAASYISKIGAGTTDLIQRVLTLKLLFIIFKRQSGLYQITEQQSIDFQPKTHEQRQTQLYLLTQKVYFAEGADNDRFVQLLKEITTGPITPNQLEE